MIARVGQFLYMTLLAPFIDTLFPPICVRCNGLLPAGRKVICRSCMAKLLPATAEIKLPLKNRSFNTIYIMFEYDEHIRRLIHLLKYKRFLTLGRYFAESADERFEFLRSYSQIIPVPLHSARQRERGYNQSAVIARNMGQILGIQCNETALLRQRFTRSQTKFSREQRAQNIKNAFVCISDLRDARVLLVDDVVTTGSTVDACATELLKAGAKRVDVFALANPTLRQSQTEHVE